MRLKESVSSVKLVRVRQHCQSGERYVQDTRRVRVLHSLRLVVRFSSGGSTLWCVLSFVDKNLSLAEEAMDLT